MGVTFVEHTLLPQAPNTYEQVERALAASRVFLSTSEDPSRVPLSRELLSILADIVNTLHRGEAVTVVPHKTILTTQEAADVLGVSRPTFVKLLEDGQIPYEQPGRHRRVQLRDVLEYRKRRSVRRSQLLDEMGGQAAERLDEEPDTFVVTR